MINYKLFKHIKKLKKRIYCIAHYYNFYSIILHLSYTIRLTKMQSNHIVFDTNGSVGLSVGLPIPFEKTCGASGACSGPHQCGSPKCRYLVGSPIPFEKTCGASGACSGPHQCGSTKCRYLNLRLLNQM